MVNLKQMVEGRLYINRFSEPSIVYKKAVNGLLLYRRSDSKIWKYSTSKGESKNFILLTDYGYGKDEDFFSRPSVTNLRIGPIGKVPCSLMSLPV